MGEAQSALVGSRNPRTCTAPLPTTCGQEANPGVPRRDQPVPPSAMRSEAPCRHPLGVTTGSGLPVSVPEDQVLAQDSRTSVCQLPRQVQEFAMVGRNGSARTEQQQADVFVIFGITGDLAKVMTFRSLYRLEKRGLLQCPIVGVAVDDWTVDQLAERARESITGTGEQLDNDVFERFVARLSYVHGDFADATTYGRVEDAIKGAECPVFYLEIPPFLFATTVKGLAEAGLTKSGRVVVEKPFGHDLASARTLADELH